jgi:hypothetical protein
MAVPIEETEAAMSYFRASAEVAIAMQTTRLP